MERRTPDENAANRAEVVRRKDVVLKKYRENVSMDSLALEYGVDLKWLRGKFDEWGEPRRNAAQAQQARSRRCAKR